MEERRARNIITTGKIEGKRNRGRQSETTLDGPTSRHKKQWIY
jgi:hypothetical protein